MNDLFVTKRTVALYGNLYTCFDNANMYHGITAILNSGGSFLL